MLCTYIYFYKHEKQFKMIPLNTTNSVENGAAVSGKTFTSLHTLE